MTEETLPQSLIRKRAITGASVKRVLAFVHLWLGLICGIPFVVLGVSGSLWMLARDLPVSTTAMIQGNDGNLGAIIAAAQTAAPESTHPVAVDLPAQPGAPTTVRFIRADQPAGRPGGGVRLQVDPVSLSVVPDHAEHSGGFERQMHDLHGRLLIPGPGGRSLVGWLGVFMTFLGLSGIVMWWPRRGQWANAFTFRFSRNGLKTNRDMHGAVGIWGLVVFIVVSFSGVYIVFPLTINDTLGAGKVVRDARGNPNPVKVAPIEGAEVASVDEAVTLARGEIKDGVVRSVQLPQAADQPFRIMMARPGDGNSTPRATVFVDPWSKSVAEVRDPRNYSFVDAFLTWQRPLHAGLALGWIWWTLVFISGFLPLLFVVTGVSMWFLKRRNKRRVMAQ